MRNGLPARTDEVLEAAAVSAYLRGDDPPNPPSLRWQGQREVAAAGAADGALGLVRPAASGSRWRKNAARQDFSRSARARRTCGRTAAVRETPATEVSRASTTASMAPARTVAASAVAIGPIRPVGPAASWARSRSSPASMASRLPSAVIAIASATRPTPRPRTELPSAYAVGRQLRDGGQQPARSCANSATADSSPHGPTPTPRRRTAARAVLRQLRDGGQQPVDLGLVVVVD